MQPQGSTIMRSGGMHVPRATKLRSGLATRIASAYVHAATAVSQHVTSAPNAAEVWFRASGIGSYANTFTERRIRRAISSKAGEPTVTGVPGLNESPSTATERGSFASKA